MNNKGKKEILNVFLWLVLYKIIAIEYHFLTNRTARGTTIIS